MTDKICELPGCGVELVRRDNESLTTFIERRFCSVDHARAANAGRPKMHTVRRAKAPAAPVEDDAEEPHGNSAEGKRAAVALPRIEFIERRLPGEPASLAERWR